MAEPKNQNAGQPAPPATPAAPPQTPAPKAGGPVSGEPVRRLGADVEAATTRVGGNADRDVLVNALANLEQRTIDRLPEDQKKGSEAEFRSFREQISVHFGDE